MIQIAFLPGLPAMQDAFSSPSACDPGSKVDVMTLQPHNSWSGLQQGHERLLHTKQRQANGPRRRVSHGLLTL